MPLNLGFMLNIFWGSEACSFTLLWSYWKGLQFYSKPSERTVRYYPEDLDPDELGTSIELAHSSLELWVGEKKIASYLH